MLAISSFSYKAKHSFFVTKILDCHTFCIKNSLVDVNSDRFLP